MSTQQHDLAYDSREGDPVYHQPPPRDSGSADSFDNRHNEFPPERGHQGAAIDPRTGQPIHGDRIPMEAPSESWPHGHDAEQPRT